MMVSVMSMVWMVSMVRMMPVMSITMIRFSMDRSVSLTRSVNRTAVPLIFYFLFYLLLLVWIKRIPLLFDLLFLIRI